ncbi:MAG: diversity-generating retroelement protein Avd [Phaeodactylibacter sp.]|nr:diversity-generating retroelement protein Avd [Phaeodactylibacter sp.]
MSKDTIIAKAYDLLKYSSPLIAKLPRSHKFTLGDRLQNMLADLLERLIEAYYSPPARKRDILLHTNILLEKIRYFFRLGYDLGLYDSLRYKDFAERINEIGRMCGGWLKSLEK